MKRTTKTFSCLSASVELNCNFSTIVLAKMGKCVHNNWDDLSFKAIFYLHHYRVYVICLRMTGSMAEAEDLTQEVFVDVFRKLGSFRDEAAFSSWLHRLTVNRVVKHLRRNLVSKAQTNSDDELPAVPVEGNKEFSRAPVLGRSGGILKSRLHKARLKMRQLLSRRIVPREIDDDVIGPDPVK
jgi:DNA-directed RNA polymerase specialized sigma24 family protein